MSAADVLYSYAFAYRWGARPNGDDWHSDPLVAAATAVMRAHLLGVRVVGTDTTSKSFRFGDFEYVRELFVIDVYTSVPPVDPEQDAVIAPPWSTLPWHLLVLMEEAVDRGWAAFSQSEARRRGVDWLDLVRSEPMNARLADLLDKFEREGSRPDPLKSLVSADDARKPWAALKAFHKERLHFLVTNGLSLPETPSGTHRCLVVLVGPCGRLRQRLLFVVIPTSKADAARRQRLPNVTSRTSNP